MSGAMELSPQVAHINELCARGGEIYLHKSSGPCRYATDDQLANAEIWEKKP